MDWIDSVVKALEGASIIIASWAVIYGVSAWRREFIGRRRIELAEDTLVLFYDARDAIRQIRFPVKFTKEGQTRERGADESPELTQLLDNSYVTIERFNKHQKLFSKIQAASHRFTAQFGKDQIQPFIKIQKATIDIITASKILSQYHRAILHHQVPQNHMAETMKKIDQE